MTFYGKTFIIEFILLFLNNVSPLGSISGKSAAQNPFPPSSTHIIIKTPTVEQIAYYYCSSSGRIPLVNYFSSQWNDETIKYGVPAETPPHIQL